LFAEPVITDDGNSFDWYTSLSGQPTAINSLPSEEQRRVRRLLNDRIQAIRGLARQLPTLEPNSPLAETLLRATTYPAENNVFVVNGQPVVTFWGYGELPERESPQNQRSRVPFLILGALTGSLLLTGLVLSAVHFSIIPTFFQATDYAALLAAERTEGTRLHEAVINRKTELVKALERCALKSTLGVLEVESVTLSQQHVTSIDNLRRSLRHCRLLKELEVLVEERQKLVKLSMLRLTALGIQRSQCVDKALNTLKVEKQRLLSKLKSADTKLSNKLSKCLVPPPAKPISPEPKPEPPPAQPRKQISLPPCPGERPPEDAPDVAIVLDASGSMRTPLEMDANNAEVVRKFEQCIASNGVMGPILCSGFYRIYMDFLNSAKGPNRFTAAQQAVNKVIAALPNDVDVGLAVLEDCPAATDYGMYNGSTRGQLLQIINGLLPNRGTPLADGLIQAAKKVDGVRSPAIMVVLSDGQDSCDNDPCNAAAMLKARKPKLKINVVDIVGDGAVNCIAEVTGGEILTPHTGISLDQLVDKAAKEAAKPEHCK